MFDGLNQFVPVLSLPGRRRLRSSFTLQLHITQYRLSTAGRAKDIPVSAVISRHHSLNSVLRYRGLCNSLGCFSHAKNS